MMVISQASIEQITERLLPRLQEHQAKDDAKDSPFIVGLTGLQGSGKSTWANALTTALEQQHALRVVNVSLDDFYHDHANLVRIREANHDNLLLRTRGQPGTHDEALAAEFFISLHSGDGVKVPSFDKSKFDGQGDRVPRSEWRYISRSPPIDVVIFEGWCVGFQSLSVEHVTTKWQNARSQLATHLTAAQTKFPTETLGDFALQHLLDINANLKVYNDTFLGPNSFDFFVHLDTDDLENVYRWRMDQEHALLRDKGEGMTDEAVLSFVRGYMPSYELYLDRLRGESLVVGKGKDSHVRVLLDRERKIAAVQMVH